MCSGEQEVQRHAEPEGDDHGPQHPVAEPACDDHAEGATEERGGREHRDGDPVDGPEDGERHGQQVGRGGSQAGEASEAVATDCIRSYKRLQASERAVLFIDELDGLLALERVSRDDFLAAVRALYYAVQWTFGRVGRYSKEHGKKLAEEAQRFAVTPEKLVIIDGLRHTPVSRNLPELMRLLFLDRILLAAASLFLTMLVLIVVTSPWFELLGVVLVGALAYRVNRMMAPRRYLQPGPKQIQAAKRITELLEVPLVVMGHSHVRKSVDLGDGRRYINTGCWLPPFAGADHTDPSQPCTCKLSHLVVDKEGKAELRVFCKAARTVRLTDISETSLTADLQRTAVERPISLVK